jgi:diadenosine tetraphosphate (Ap4A) HIT family hydrolase
MVRVIEEADVRRVYEAWLASPPDEKSARFCREALGGGNVDRRPDGYNIGVNEGRVAGRTIDHMHVHILPRFSGDVDDAVGGIRNVLAGKGNYVKDECHKGDGE